MWDEIRRQLGGDLAYGPGSWFCVVHGQVFRPDGYLFAEHKAGGDGRRVVLATSLGPNATLFARSASRESPHPHVAHDHGSGSKRCKLDRDGWVNFRLPVSVAADFLSEHTYSCLEPDGSGLYEQLDEAVGL